MKLSPDHLRQQALQSLGKTPQAGGAHLSKDADWLSHELRVHQEELKIQNETLRNANFELEEANRRYQNLYRHYYQKYLDLYDNAPVGYCTVDQHGAMTDINRKGSVLLGEDAANLRGKKIYDFIPEHERDMIFLSLRRLFGAGLGGSTEIEMRRLDGTSFFARLDYSMTDGDELTERRCRLTIVDVTEKERFEAALRKSEKKFRTLFEEMAEGVFYQRSDGRLIDINPAALEILGVTYDEFIARKSGHSEWDIINENGSPLTDDEHPSMVALKTGKPVINVTAGVYNSRRGDYGWLKINAIPQFRPGEIKPYQVFVTIHDITDLKKAERKRALDEARLEALLTLSAMDDATLERVTDYVLEQIVRLTESRLGFIGFIDEEEGGMSMHAWSEAALAECAVKDRPLHFKIADAGLWAEAIRRRRPFTVNAYDAAHPKKKGCPGGHVRIDRFLSVPIFDGDRIVAIAAVGNKARDYDEADIRQIRLMGNGLWRWVRQREAERQIQASMEEKELLMREIHHRAKNSLNTVMSLIGVCGQRADDSRIDAYFRDLRNRVMAMSRVHEALYRSEDIKSLDFGRYLEKVTAETQTGFAQVPAAIRIDARDIQLPCETAMQCGRIVAELTTNAFKYAFPNADPSGSSTGSGRIDAPEIRIEMRQEAGEYRLSVADNGVGLPPGFDVRNVETLGLDLVRNWTERQLMGTLAVSGPPGAVFTITFRE